MSPEQAMGSRDPVDHRSDIWSLGATLFTAMTGQTVHLGANVQAKLLAAATVKARSITLVMPDLPPGVAAVIDMALRFKKEDRWQSTDAMRRAFREAREAAGFGRLDNRSDRVGGALLRESAVPPPLARVPTVPPEGPNGTFMGIGSGPSDLSPLMGNDGSVPPPKSPRTSTPPPLPARARMASISGSDPRSAFGDVDKGDAWRMTPTDARESSVPAYGNTLFARDTGLEQDSSSPGRSRSGTLGIWLMAALLGAAVLGGVVFFAVRRGSAVTATSPSTNAAPRIVVDPAPSSSVIELGDTPPVPASASADPVPAAPAASASADAGGATIDGGGNVQASTVSGARVFAGRMPYVPPNPYVMPKPPDSAVPRDPPKPPPSGPPSDPFGTPE
jgi:serine/threonine-protein kinase